MDFLQKLWKDKPLFIILLAGIFFRVLAIIFSKGYAMMDDHYLVIEQAQQWVDNIDGNKWLPSYGAAIPSGHSLFYVGIHFFIFKGLEFVGILDPQIKMYFIRLILAAYSLITILFGYKIALHYSDKNSAKTVAVLLSVLWLFPFLSVRNLVEFSCIPVFIYGLWLVIKSIDKNKNILIMFVAGLITGISISIRFQAVLLIIGLGMALIFKKKWIAAICYSLGAIISFAIIQGIIDGIIWGRPFAEFTEYLKYNLENRYNYFTGNWYNYILLILGLLIPPVSFFIFFGWIRTWKKYLIVFLPAFVFLLFHMYFPNRQERFILPILPLIIISGIIGWNEFVTKSAFWGRRKKMLYYSWVFFWLINISLLIPLSITYTKRSYAEAMTYLKNKSVKCLVVDDKNHDSNPIMPRFYLDSWDPIYYSSGVHPYSEIIYVKDYLTLVKKPLPQYFVFLETENLQNRVDSINKIFPGLELDTIIEPGLIDKVMHFLNNHNKNQTIVIYHRKYKVY
jgi:hypothetical protein